MDQAKDADDLDLSEVNWPFCLLELKSVLKNKVQGQLLRVKVSDPAVLYSMQRIIRSSKDRVVETEHTGPFYHLTIAKG